MRVKDQESKVLSCLRCLIVGCSFVSECLAFKSVVMGRGVLGFGLGRCCLWAEMDLYVDVEGLLIETSKPTHGERRDRAVRCREGGREGKCSYIHAMYPHFKSFPANAIHVLPPVCPLLRHH